MEKVAGVDFGATHVKVAWQEKDGWELRSTAHESLRGIADELRAASVNNISVVGIKARQKSLNDFFSDFERVPSVVDLVQAELLAQVNGAKVLLKRVGHDASQIVVVGVGSGVSFVRAIGEEVFVAGIGNHVGGGAIGGEFLAQGQESLVALDEVASLGEHQNLLFKDVDPDLEGTIPGELVVSYFGKVTGPISLADRMATVIHGVAALLVHDLWMYKTMGFWSGQETIVYLGTSISLLSSLRSCLSHFHDIGRKLGMFESDPVFLENGQYATAIGAATKAA